MQALVHGDYEYQFDDDQQKVVLKVLPGEDMNWAQMDDLLTALNIWNQSFANVDLDFDIRLTSGGSLGSG